MTATAAHKRILHSIQDHAGETGEVLLHVPRRDLLRVGRDGVSANWRTFEYLKEAGLITTRPGFAASNYVALTAEGRQAINGSEP